VPPSADVWLNVSVLPPWALDLPPAVLWLFCELPAVVCDSNVPRRLLYSLLDRLSVSWVPPYVDPLPSTFSFASNFVFVKPFIWSEYVFEVFVG
jgi:hypothetical protein